MSHLEWKRREFVRVLLSLPLGYAVGCGVGSGMTAQDALGKLVLALGPWAERERKQAEEFVSRFLAAEHLVGLYIQESHEVIRSLASRFPDGAIAISELDLASLPAEERRFIIPFVEQLYSLVEVRFYIASEPRWGVCVGERTRYTLAPV
jgi:hypothetical protein